MYSNKRFHAPSAKTQAKSNPRKGGSECDGNSTGTRRECARNTPGMRRWPPINPLFCLQWTLLVTDCPHLPLIATIADFFSPNGAPVGGVPREGGRAERRTPT